jgi:hypothetical protein
VSSAIRLTFGYEGSSVRLLDYESIEMLAPPGEPEAIPKGASGFWVELRDQRGRRLYQHAMRQPVRYEAEVFPENHAELPHYVPRSTVEGAFVVLVPEIPGAHTAVLFSSPPEPGRSGEPASELIEVQLRKRRPSRSDRRQ